MKDRASTRQVTSRVPVSCAALLLLLLSTAPAMSQFATKPEEPQRVTVYALRHVEAPAVADIVSNLLGDVPTGMRIAVDDRSNSLILYADKETHSTVEALIRRLDEAAGDAPRDHVELQQTLQLRVVWLLDGLPEGQGKPPTARVVSPQVVDALKELGFEDPQVVSQQVTTLTAQKQRGGRYQFLIPVLVHEQVWQFQGTGTVMPMADARFNIEFNLQVRPAGAADRGARTAAVGQGQLGGSIQMPLRHYTVMGTTTFVGPEEPPHQYQSAFVVYLDDAREFPSSKQ